MLSHLSKSTYRLDTDRVRAFVLGVILLFLAPSIPCQWAFAQEAEASKPREFITAIERVAEGTIPAVVHIEVTERQEMVSPMSPFQDNPFLQYFFNIPETP